MKAHLVKIWPLWFRLGHFDGGTGANSKPERLLMIFKLSGYPAEIFKHETLLVSRSLYIKGYISYEKSSWIPFQLVLSRMKNLSPTK